jgi:hypothetical protein
MESNITLSRQRELQTLEALIGEQYELGTRGLLIRDKHWFSKPKNTLLANYTTVEKEQWLASVSNARWRWMRRRERAQASQENSRRLFRRWLNPAVANAGTTTTNTT